MTNVFIKLWRIFLKICLCFFIISIASVILFRWLPVPVTPLMLLRCAEQMIDSPVSQDGVKSHKREVKLKKQWVTLKKISPNLQLAVICAEDQNFFEHFGFDFESIEKAMEHNKKYKRKRGASTITQQTAKNLFLYDGRNWIRKGFEAYFTFLIEIFWSKERILEVYLNVVEFGDGIYGAEAASQQFFSTSAKNLTRQQAALLAAVLPSPRRFSAITPSNYVLKRQQWILQQMDNWGEDLRVADMGKISFVY